MQYLSVKFKVELNVKEKITKTKKERKTDKNNINVLLSPSVLWSLFNYPNRVHMWHSASRWSALSLATYETKQWDSPLINQSQSCRIQLCFCVIGLIGEEY